MTDELVRNILERLSVGEMSVDDAVRELRFAPFADLGFAKVDHHRELRSGLPEAVYGPGKTPQQAAAIVEELMSRGTGPVLVTRASTDQFDAIQSVTSEASYNETCGLIVARAVGGEPLGVAVVASAGTADQPVADEAAFTAEAIGLKVERLSDVGVAGLHRLLASREALDRADVIIVVAGMEGALASIVSGLVAAPVVAVPTSVGYGAGAGGIAPLLTMLNSCAPGVAVVNIDNGYGAAVFARLVLTASR
jgi:NCAIR mutase (PurE)-related protein